mmetsp:Transcript_6205/g.18712  ORF Transcript_6205/g.18712 Transcript_6205/m.18712 type:complete len:202 (+) Transcript_6205:124-729(+)
MDRGIFAAVTMVALMIALARGLNFNLAENEEMCFHEMTHKGNKVLASFEVMTWTYGSYVNLVVKSPSGKIIKEDKASAEGKVDFNAEEDGEYNFCFKAAHGSKTEVKFWVNTEIDFGLTDVVKEEHVADMVVAVERLSTLVNAARTDLEAFKSREARHRRLALQNGRQVTMWAVGECILIVAVAAAQIFRVQKFLENKRSI